MGHEETPQSALRAGIAGILPLLPEDDCDVVEKKQKSADEQSWFGLVVHVGATKGAAKVTPGDLWYESRFMGAHSQRQTSSLRQRPEFWEYFIHAIFQPCSI